MKHAKQADGRVFTGTVPEDAVDANGSAAIAKGSAVELPVGKASSRGVRVDIPLGAAAPDGGNGTRFLPRRPPLSLQVEASR